MSSAHLVASYSDLIVCFPLCSNKTRCLGNACQEVNELQARIIEVNPRMSETKKGLNVIWRLSIRQGELFTASSHQNLGRYDANNF